MIINISIPATYNMQHNSNKTHTEEYNNNSYSLQQQQKKEAIRVKMQDMIQNITERRSREEEYNKREIILLTSK